MQLQHRAHFEHPGFNGSLDDALQADNPRAKRRFAADFAAGGIASTQIAGSNGSARQAEADPGGSALRDPVPILNALLTARDHRQPMTQTNFDVVGIGNAIVDVIAHADERVSRARGARQGDDDLDRRRRGPKRSTR